MDSANLVEKNKLEKLEDALWKTGDTGETGNRGDTGVEILCSTYLGKNPGG